MWTRFHASVTFDHLTPCGKRASGVRRMSWVGVTANFRSSASGPMAATTSRTRSATCIAHHGRRPAGRRHSTSEIAVREDRSLARDVRRRLVTGAAGSVAVVGRGAWVVVLTRCSSGG